jgi:glucose-6-phosphate 1-dehydrogenase
MTNPHSDALVFFGVTGDLAYKRTLVRKRILAPRDYVSICSTH